MAKEWRQRVGPEAHPDDGIYRGDLPCTDIADRRGAEEGRDQENVLLRQEVAFSKRGPKRRTSSAIASSSPRRQTSNLSGNSGNFTEHALELANPHLELNGVEHGANSAD
jgi:hypothetical protein